MAIGQDYVMKRLLMSVALIALPALASAGEYICNTTSVGRNGGVSSKLYLAYDAATGKAYAYDGFISQVSEDPIEVKWKQRSETSHQYNWTVKGIDITNSGKGIISHRVILFLDRMEFSLSGRLHGFGNVISGEGTCKKAQ